MDLKLYTWGKKDKNAADLSCETKTWKKMMKKENGRPEPKYGGHLSCYPLDQGWVALDVG